MAILFIAAQILLGLWLGWLIVRRQRWW